MPAISTVDIVNMAIVPLGARPIAALDEGTKAATLANSIFDTERDATLQAHEWNFAVKRVSLAKDLTGPIFGFASSFQLPADYIRVVESSVAGLRYKIEGKKFLCDETSISIRYIRQVTSPAEWSPSFASVLAARLRWKMAFSLTEMVSKEQSCAKEYEALLGEARTLDSQESGPESAIDTTADVLIDARRGGGTDGLSAGLWWQA